jgi:hypothetical protein
MNVNDSANRETAELYERLSDVDLRSAIHAAEAHLRSASPMRRKVHRAYRSEIASMQRLLADRERAQITVRQPSLSGPLRRALYCRLRARAIPLVRIRALVQAASGGRTDRLRALTDVEAIAILLCLVSAR